jgi:hypothetical protein
VIWILGSALRGYRFLAVLFQILDFVDCFEVGYLFAATIFSVQFGNSDTFS